MTPRRNWPPLLACVAAIGAMAPFAGPSRAAAGPESAGTITHEELVARYADEDSRFVVLEGNDGIKVHYKDQGSGPVVLLVHSSTGDLKDYDGWVEILGDDYRIVRFDLPAFGLTGPVPSGNYSIDRFLTLVDSLMDHLGINEFLFIGYCIGGPFAMKLIERAPERVQAAVLCQPVGHSDKTPDSMYDSGVDVWAPELMKNRPDVTMEIVEQYLHNLYRVQPDFFYCVSRDFARQCQTPLLVMPDDTPSHSYVAAMAMAELAPKAQVTVYPWKEDADIKANTVEQVREFLKAHQPVKATA